MLDLAFALALGYGRNCPPPHHYHGRRNGFFYHYAKFLDIVVVCLLSELSGTLRL